MRFDHLYLGGGNALVEQFNAANLTLVVNQARLKFLTEPGDSLASEEINPGNPVQVEILDVNGNLWVAAGISIPRTSGETADVPPGIYVIKPDGTLVGRIPIPEDVITNLAFGGPDRKTLLASFDQVRRDLDASGTMQLPTKMCRRSIMCKAA